ncbi:hypothetical protein PG995_000148 [Apiospora arundinis]
MQSLAALLATLLAAAATVTATPDRRAPAGRQMRRLGHRVRRLGAAGPDGRQRQPLLHLRRVHRAVLPQRPGPGDGPLLEERARVQQPLLGQRRHLRHPLHVQRHARTHLRGAVRRGALAVRHAQGLLGNVIGTTCLRVVGLGSGF